MSNWDKLVEKRRKSGNYPLLDALEPKKKSVAKKMSSRTAMIKLSPNRRYVNPKKWVEQYRKKHRSDKDIELLHEGRGEFESRIKD